MSKFIKSKYKNHNCFIEVYFPKFRKRYCHKCFKYFKKVKMYKLEYMRSGFMWSEIVTHYFCLECCHKQNLEIKGLENEAVNNEQ